VKQLVIDAVPGTVLDEHEDLDAERPEELLASEREEQAAKSVGSRPCRCDRPLVVEDGPDEARCVWCGRAAAC
jgi:hypothetical protein